MPCSHDSGTSIAGIEQGAGDAAIGRHLHHAAAGGQLHFEGAIGIVGQAAFGSGEVFAVQLLRRPAVRFGKQREVVHERGRPAQIQLVACTRLAEFLGHMHARAFAAIAQMHVDLPMGEALLQPLHEGYIGMPSRVVMQHEGLATRFQRFGHRQQRVMPMLTGQQHVAFARCGNRLRGVEIRRRSPVLSCSHRCREPPREASANFTHSR